MPGARSARRLLSVALVLSTLAACSFPHDAEGTLARVREQGVLRVGISEHAPWTVLSDGRAEGIEPPLVSAWAERLGARVEWVDGAESSLAEALAERRIDLLVGGFDTGSPWVSEAAATQPYGDGHVMLVPQGENALLFSLDRFLAEVRRSGAIPRTEPGA